MRRSVFALALLIVALLALCGLVIGILVWQNQANLAKTVEDLQSQMNGSNGQQPTPPPTNPLNPNPTTPPTTPPTSNSCLEEGEYISVDSTGEECCAGLVEVDLTDAEALILDGFSARCVQL